MRARIAAVALVATLTYPPSFAGPTQLLQAESETAATATIARAHEEQLELDKADRERTLNLLTGIAAGASVLLALITGGLAYFTLQLWKATGTLVRDAEETARRELRAYVSVDSGSARDARGEPILNQMVLELQNDGKTPAHKLRQWTGIAVKEFPLAAPLAEPESTPLQKRLQTSSMLNPGRKRAVLFDYPVEKIRAAKTAIERGEAALYVWGKVTYEDVFGNIHETKFTFFHDKEGMKFHRLGHYMDGNEAT